MDAYKTPASKLIDNTNRPFEPVKGVLVGLIYTVIITTITSIAWLVAVGSILGFDLASPDLESEMAQSPIYLISDMIVGAVILYFGGRAVGTRTPGKEIKYGAVLATITVFVYMALMIATESLDTYPLVYTLATIVITIAVIPYGSKRAAKA